MTAPVPERQPQRASGGAVAGLLLVAAGVAWLLGATGAVDWSAETWIGAHLVAVGAALVALPGAAGRGLLVALGIVLSLAGAAAAAIDVEFEGGVGEERFTPESLAELEDEYALAVGSLGLDLRGLEPVGEEAVAVEASVGVGELVVAVPEDATVELDASVGTGDVQALGEQDGGFGADIEQTFDGGGPVYRLDLSVGIGSIKVVEHDPF